MEKSIFCEDSAMDAFLDSLTNPESPPVKIIIKNGFQLVGRLLDWDYSVLLVEVNGVKQLIMLHAVSTISPQKA